MTASDPGAFFEIGQGRLLGGGDFQLRAKRRGISHLESQGKGQAEAAGGAKVLRQEVAGQRRPRCPAHLSNSLSNLTGSPRTAALGHGLCALPSSMGHELYSRQLSPPSRGGGGRRGTVASSTAALPPLPAPSSQAHSGVRDRTDSPCPPGTF